MNRRDFVVSSLFAGGALVPLPSMGSSPGSEDDVIPLTVYTERSLGRIAPDFIGLGYEISSVATPGLLSRANASYLQLVRTLGAHGVIRIGGNTADYAMILRSLPRSLLQRERW